MCWMNEYPRPQLRRADWFNLNGEWLLNGMPLQVPFPPQSRISAYAGELGEELEYSRSFILPEGFGENKRVRLHFGAVDQIADVFVNDVHAAHHEGGYLPFWADVTGALHPGENHLRVKAADTLSHDYPYGKQKKKRGGMWYTPVSGIWQTVWMEAVPENCIEGLRIEPDLKGIILTVHTAAQRCRIEIHDVLQTEIATNHPVRIDIPDPQLWTCERPHLYDFAISTENDRVESYFALRTIGIGEAGGRQRILLNGKPVFLNGVLDQGYFEDGIYLPASPGEYARDVQRMKSLGINLLRKHCKIEPEAFYHACDRMGMLVMQDMVNSGGYNFLLDTALPTIGLKFRPDRLRGPANTRRKQFFTQHALDTQAQLFNHPCVVAYTIFNEGWGQFDADRHYDLLKAADPSRIYDATSGWFAQKRSDVDSEHVYFRNKRLNCGKRPMLLSECGGYARAVPGHMFNENHKYGYGTTDSEAALTGKIEQMWREMVLPAILDGLCGVIYTQLSDVEDEINGLYTYDRAVCKADPVRLRSLAARAQAMLEGK